MTLGLLSSIDDGIDCRVHSVKVVSNKQKQNGLNRDLFDKNLVKYVLIHFSSSRCSIRHSMSSFLKTEFMDSGKSYFASVVGISFRNMIIHF